MVVEQECACPAGLDVGSVLRHGQVIARKAIVTIHAAPRLPHPPNPFGERESRPQPNREYLFNSLLDAQALLHPLHRLGRRIILRHQPEERLL